MDNVPSDPPPQRGDLRPSALPRDSERIPPHPLDGEWYIHLNGETYGPYTGHRLADFLTDGRIDGSTQVLPVGSQDWGHASEDRRLAPLFRRVRQQQQLPPPISAAAGSTVVQVTNQIAPHPYMLMDDGMPFAQNHPASHCCFLSCGVVLDNCTADALAEAFGCSSAQWPCGSYCSAGLFRFGQW